VALGEHHATNTHSLQTAQVFTSPIHKKKGGEIPALFSIEKRLPASNEVNQVTDILRIISGRT